MGRPGSLLLVALRPELFRIVYQSGAVYGVPADARLGIFQLYRHRQLERHRGKEQIRALPLTVMLGSPSRAPAFNLMLTMLSGVRDPSR